MSSKMNASTLIAELVKSRRIMIKQMKMLGYNTEKYESFTTNEVNIMTTTSGLDMTMTKDSGEKVYVKYEIGKSFRPTHVTNIVEELFDGESHTTPGESELKRGKDRLVIIVGHEPNDSIHATMKRLYDTEKIFINVIPIKRLLFNILEHKLVPPHRELTMDEMRDLMTKYNVTRTSELPEISRFDPVAQVIGLRPGRICEITRHSPTALHGKYYRVCI